MDASAEKTVALRMAGDVEIVVPATPFSITTFVLLEQEDWFEPEIRFVRRLARPGMTMLDIGANHGVFALAMARGVGATGRVDAFEPSAEVAARLRDSAARNGFAQLHVHENAVGARAGTMILSHDRAELRRVSETGTGVTVAMIRLDDRPRARRVDFVKIDVEGAETDVIAGGADFFARESPLVMLEMRDAGELRLEALHALMAMGYEPYLLLPGPEILAPTRLEPETLAACQTLNVFAAKRDRAAVLRGQGLLALPGAATVPARDGLAFAAAQPAFAQLGVLFDRMRDAPSTPGRDAHRAALDAYAVLMDATCTPEERVAAAEAAIDAITIAVTEDLGSARLLSAMAIGRAVDRRPMLQVSLDHLTTRIESGVLDMQEPFIVPLPCYAAMDVSREGFGAWLDALTKETSETLLRYSAAFDAAGVIARVDRIEARGYLTAALERRRQLIRIITAGARSIEPNPILRSADCLNSRLWASPEAARAWLPD